MTTPPKILLLGGHGKISLLMTPKILSRSWNLVSMIRDSSQTDEILSVGKAGPGKVEVLVESLEDVKSEADAKAILDRVKPDWVVWSAGAGGKGGAERTNAIDRNACIYFIRSSLRTSHISKFLLISALSSRRGRASWFNDDDWEMTTKFNTVMAPAYYKAKLAADEELTVKGREKEGFGYLVLRPGQLVDDEEKGRISFGKTRARGAVARGDVAEVAVRLLEKEGVRGWFDMLGGEEEVGAAVDRVLKEGFDSVKGEDLGVMRENLGTWE